jgi:hypothetical protein
MILALQLLVIRRIVHFFISRKGRQNQYLIWSAQKWTSAQTAPPPSVTQSSAKIGTPRDIAAQHNFCCIAASCACSSFKDALAGKLTFACDYIKETLLSNCPERRLDTYASLGSLSYSHLPAPDAAT